jgi:RimJ/RimL family protein N-acetyltransferase
MHSLDTFTTERLVARRVQPEHFAEMFRLHQDPRVMATLGGKLFDENLTKAIVERALTHWDQHQFGVWMWYDRRNGDFVGRGGIRHAEIEGQAEIELLYALIPDYWRQGVATELALASIDIGFHQLGFDNIAAWTLPTNLGSQGVMKKAGLQYERDVVWADLPHVLFRRRRAEIAHQ